MREEDTHVTKRVIDINVDECRCRERRKKRWIDGVSSDLKEKLGNDAVTSDRGEWKNNIYDADFKDSVYY